MPHAQLTETRLWFEEMGAGPRCLVMHGGLGIDHHSYRPGPDSLAEHLRLVYYDHRGHGGSDPVPLETLTLAQLAEDADELRHFFGDGRIGVMGHSFGGFIAYEYASRHPDRVAFLVIVCSSPSVDFGDRLTAEMDRRLTNQMRAVLELPEPASSEEWRRRSRVLLPLYFHRWDPAYARALTVGWADYSAAIAAGRDLDGWTRWADLHRITCPTLLVMGDDDFIPHRDRVAEVAELLPDGVVLTIRDSGHYPWLEQPEQFFDGVTSWLEERHILQP